jgi:hypothetical protein
MSLSASIDTMLALAEEIRVLATSFIQLPALNERQSEFADQIWKASQRLIDALMIGINSREAQDISAFRFECRTYLNMVESCCNLYREQDLITLPAPNLNILQLILDNVRAIRERLDHFMDNHPYPD